MRKLLAILIVLVLTLTIGSAVVLAAPGGKDSPANDNPQNLYLYPKDPDGVDNIPNNADDWSIVWGGAWGKYNYSLSGTTISGPFNGHGLVVGTNYSLIYYPEPQTTWPWPVVVIGSDTADADGNVHIAGTANLGVSSNIKIWLVRSADINATPAMAGWNPTRYLFEHNLIP